MSHSENGKGTRRESKQHEHRHGVRKGHLRHRKARYFPLTEGKMIVDRHGMGDRGGSMDSGLYFPKEVWLGSENEVTRLY